MLTIDIPDPCCKNKITLNTPGEQLQWICRWCGGQKEETRGIEQRWLPMDTWIRRVKNQSGFSVNPQPILEWLSHLRQSFSSNFTFSRNNNCYWKGPLEITLSYTIFHIEQGHVQMDLKYLQGQRLHNLSGHPVSVLGLPHSKEMFLSLEERISV